jgi:uncharacterized membrane protein YhaH (DUF805 family)
MNFREVMASIRYAFVSMFRFSGRDARGLFWPWAIFVVLLGQALQMLAMTPVMAGSFVRMVEAVRPRDYDGGAAVDPAVIERAVTRMMTDLGALWLPMAVIHIVTVAALAAAVVRRLHDANRTALWALLPLPFMALSTALMPAAFAFAAAPAKPTAQMQLLLLSGPFFWAALLWLGFLLAGKGTDGPNRFGEATSETP